MRLPAAFRTPGFRRLYGGLAASMFGDSLMLIVLSMWVKSLTGSNGAAGLTFLWMTAPALFAPAFGYVVDRVPRRAFLVVANLLSALAMVPLLFVHSADDVWIVYTVAACYGISFVVVPAALNGLLKDLLPEDVLVDANASLSVTREAFRLLGPILGAAVFGLVGGGAVAMVDAATFVVAALAVGTLRVVEPAALEQAEPLPWRTEVVAGIRHIRHTPLLLHTTLALGICLLVLGFSESVVYAVLDAFGRPVEFVGLVVTVQGVGAVISGLLSSRVIKRLGEPLAVLGGLAVLALGLAMVAAAEQIWEVLIGVGVFGAGIPLIIVAYNTILQKQTPGRLMGRVSTATEVLTTTPQAISIATGAVLVGLLSYHVIFSLMALGTIAAGCYLVAVLHGRLGAVPGLAPQAPPVPLGGVDPLAPVVAEPRDASSTGSTGRSQLG